MTFNQTDHVLIEKFKRADCDTNHYLVRIKYKEIISKMDKFKIAILKTDENREKN